MRGRRLAYILAVLSVGQPLEAQRRARPAIPSTTATNPRISILHTEFASMRDARDALTRSDPALIQCLQAAATADPVPLTRIRWIDVTVGLLPTGRADAVDIDASGLPQGLSACLGAVFLAWNQGGHPGVPARVLVHIDLGAANNR